MIPNQKASKPTSPRGKKTLVEIIDGDVIKITASHWKTFMAGFAIGRFVGFIRIVIKKK